MAYKQFVPKYTRDANNFMKILIACGATIDQLQDWTWEIECDDVNTNNYRCIGCHPVVARIDLYGKNIVIH